MSVHILIIILLLDSCHTSHSIPPRIPMLSWQQYFYSLNSTNSSAAIRLNFVLRFTYQTTRCKYHNRVDPPFYLTNSSGGNKPTFIMFHLANYGLARVSNFHNRKDLPFYTSQVIPIFGAQIIQNLLGDFQHPTSFHCQHI